MMKTRKPGLIRWLCLMVLLTGTLPGQGQEEEQDQDIQVEVQTSQTSVWPGDRIHYIVTLTMARNVKLAMEDFDPENVTFEPLVLLGSEVREQDQGETIRHTFDYLLANYEIGDRGIDIPGLIFRYERGGTNEVNTPTAQEMQIPPVPLSVRSTLNQPAERSWIREDLSTSAWPRQAWLLMLTGVAGLGISCLPLGAWAWKQIPDWQARRRQLSRKKFLNRCLGQLNQVETELGSDGTRLKEHYEALEKLLHEYTLYFYQVETRGLTHAELAGRLNSEVPGSQRETLDQVLERGRACRYAPEGTGSEENLREDLQKVRRLFA